MASEATTTQPRRVHAHELQAVAVAADQMQADPGRELVVAGVECDAAAVHLAHHAGDVLDVERHAQARVAHVAPVAYAISRSWRWKGARENLEVADVVVVHVADDHVLDACGVDVERGQALARVADDLAVAPRSGLLGKARVDHEHPLGRLATQRKKSSGIGPSHVRKTKSSGAPGVVELGASIRTARTWSVTTCCLPKPLAGQWRAWFLGRHYARPCAPGQAVEVNRRWRPRSQGVSLIVRGRTWNESSQPSWLPT